MLIISPSTRTQGLDPKTVQMIVQEFFTEILENLKKSDRFEFRDFGVFETVVRKKKIGRNPKNLMFQSKFLKKEPLDLYRAKK